MKRLAIIGSASAGGAGQIIEALNGQNVLKAVLILDREQTMIGKEVHGVPVAGPAEELIQRWNKKEFDVAVIAIGGDLNERKRLYDILTANAIPLANIIDPTVKLGLNTEVGNGNVILNNSYIGNNVQVGDNNYILNQCSIQHDTIIESHNYLATNVTIGAKVQIGSLNRLGIKSIVETRSIIGNGQVFKSAAIVSYNS